MVHTRRTCAHGRPNESSHHGKNDHANSYPPSHPRGPPISPHEHRNQYHQIGSMTRQGYENEIRAAGLHFGEVANQDTTSQMLPPRENRQECMHTPCQAGCPRLRSQLSWTNAPCMANYPHLVNPFSPDYGRQQVTKLNVPHSEPTPLALTSHNGPVLGPTLLHSHLDGPRLEAITHSPKLPTSSNHSHHEQSSSSPTRPRSRDGKP